jgi:hypothetical protein
MGCSAIGRKEEVGGIHAQNFSVPFNYTLYTRLHVVTSPKPVTFTVLSCFQTLRRMRPSSIKLYILGLMH